LNHLVYPEQGEGPVARNCITDPTERFAVLLVADLSVREPLASFYCKLWHFKDNAKQFAVLQLKKRKRMKVRNG
jgi:hypothetical protein